MKLKFAGSFVLSFIAFSSFSQNDGEYHLDKEYSVGLNGTIKLSCSDAKVWVVGSNRTTAHVKIDRVVTARGFTFGHREFGVDVNEEGGNLELIERSHSVSVAIIGYYREEYTIRLEVPNGVSLTVKGDDGSYRIQDLAGAISLRLDDAHVELTGCTGNSFEFRMSDGKIKMDQGKGRLDIRGNDTNVHILNAAFSDVHTDLDDGDLIIETSLADKGNYDIESQDGLISLTVLNGGGSFNIHHQDGRVTTEGNFNINEKSDNDMRLTLADGKARVNIRADDGRVKLVSR